MADHDGGFFHELEISIRGFFHKLRVALFGAVTPKRWFRDSAEMSVAEVLDPQQSDIREVLPEEPHETQSVREASTPPEHPTRK